VCACIALAVVFALPLCARADALLDEAAALLAAGQPADAVALLEPHELARAGDPDYDALLGAALLQAGDAARASLALERATTAGPGLAGARLDLAIAYFRMGAREDARQTLLALRELDPPAEAARAIDTLLTEIDRGERRVQLSLDVALASGYDSNANGATALDEFLGFTLTETSREASSDFYEAAARAGVRVPVGERGLSFDTGLGLRTRVNPDAGFVDATSGDLSLGISHDTARAARALGLFAYRLDADGELNSRGAGLFARWQRALRERLSVGGFARAVAVRYGDGLEIKDVDAVVVGAELAHVWGPAGNGGVRVDLYGGRDSPQQDGSPYGRDLYGIDAGMSWRFSDALAGQLGAGWMRSDYDDAFFPQAIADDRRDERTQARAAVEWAWRPAWILAAELSWTRNSTNVDIFEYDRVALRLAALRRF
jgi:tetratricopeptide (TPR) repeat protein